MKKTLKLILILLIPFQFGICQNNPISKSIYKLNQGEEFVYGKTGIFEDGNLKYSFAVIRKKNNNKELYRREVLPYQSNPILRGGTLRKEVNPKEYDFYDYYVVFNGKKMGPFDRLMDINYHKPDVDDWVSRDGKSITFTTVRGQKYYPIIGNHKMTYYWSVVQTPIVDIKSGKSTYGVQWDNSSYRFFDTGLFKSSFKKFDAIKFSEDGKDMIYVAAETDRNKKYIYRNNEKIAGPFEQVHSHSGFDFIPGTNKMIYLAWGKIINGKRHTEVCLGDKTLTFDDTKNINWFNYSKDWIVFVVDYKKQNWYQNKALTVYEYNVHTKELKTHGEYGHDMMPEKMGDKFYYHGFSKNGDKLLVGMGGKILEKYPASSKYYVTFKCFENGDYYSWYQPDDKYETSVVLKKNGQVYKVHSYPRQYFPQIKYKNNKTELALYLDQTVGSKKIFLRNGDASFVVEGDGLIGDIKYAKSSGDIYTITRHVLADNRYVYDYSLYKNGEEISTRRYKAINELSISDNGERYAALVVTDNIEKMCFYRTTNRDMSIKRKLIVDGKIYSGNYGAPKWSNKENCFIALQEQNGEIKIMKF
ncbi:MAG: hypothetical protein N4A49_00035 [Marinifilaceae bacterium]|jgi:hypothetical protein|nr:hypothetical protein [Marinifilaceae bacterium]